VQRWRSWQVPNVRATSSADSTDNNEAYSVALKNVQAAATTALGKAADFSGPAQQRQYWA